MTKPKIDKRRQKIAPTTLLERAVQEFLDFFTPRGDLASILAASKRFWVLPSAFSGVPARPWGLPGCSQDALGVVPGRAGHAPDHPWELLGCLGVLMAALECSMAALGCSMTVPGRISGVLGTTLEAIRIDFANFFDCLVA